MGMSVIGTRGRLVSQLEGLFLLSNMRQDKKREFPRAVCVGMVCTSTATKPTLQWSINK